MAAGAVPQPVRTARLHYAHNLPDTLSAEEAVGAAEVPEVALPGKFLRIPDK